MTFYLFTTKYFFLSKISTEDIQVLKIKEVPQTDVEVVELWLKV